MKTHFFQQLALFRLIFQKLGLTENVLQQSFTELVLYKLRGKNIEHIVTNCEMFLFTDLDCCEHD